MLLTEKETAITEDWWLLVTEQLHSQWCKLSQKLLSPFPSPHPHQACDPALTWRDEREVGFFFLSLLFFSSYSKNTGKAANYCQLQHSFLQWHLSTGNSSETTNHFSNKPPNSCQMIQDFDHYWPEHTQTKDFMMKDISHLESPEPSSPSEHWCCFFLNKAFQEVAKIALKP